MIWMIEKLKTRLFLEEVTYDLDIPIQIEIEYRLEGNKVDSSSISRKVRYNRPLLIKEARSRSVEQLDRMIDQEVQKAIERHLSSRGYILGKE